MEHDDALVRPGDTAAGSPAGVGRQQAGTGGDEARSGRRDGAEGRRDAAVAPGPGASVVEWGGSDTHDPFTIVLTAAQLRRYLAYPLAVAAGVVAFVAMVREWQVIRAEGFGPVFREDESLSVGLIGSYGFGVIWMAGTLALVVALVVALFGDHGVRRVARLAGVALAATLLLTLAAAAVNFTRYSGIYGGADLRVQEGLALEVGMGVYLAAVSVVLSGAAVSVAPRAAAGDAEPDWRWRDLVGWMRTRRTRQRTEPVDGPVAGGPADLTVTPAEPFSRDGAA